MVFTSNKGSNSAVTIPSCIFIYADLHVQSTTIKPPAPDVTVTSTDIAPTESECIDAKDVDCILYNPKIICNDTSIYYPWARVRCPYYCGFCHRPTLTILCKDEIPTCRDYSADLCTNPLYRIFRERKCRKYCGICKDFDSVPNIDSLVG
ncbi:uncharacterized protein LOC134258655 [Saccostrea cucullata]|uniref:uncharacterized protein LOC134258655 n=1 Tax=Saccostrea cuccullata TaxID=36930 RepID=UPI002ED36E7F